MSRYEWEKGEFVLPSAEWAGFKASIREAVNRSNVEMLDTAMKLHAALAIRLKGMRGPDIWSIGWEEMEKLNRQLGAYSVPRFSETEQYEIVSAVVDRGWGIGRDKRPERVRKPQKKHFPQHGNNVTSYSCGECSVSFDNATRTATWSVGENNHACETARETVLGKALFAALRQVKWTRGSGGRIWGNDEYNQDSGRDYSGEGGSYDKESYGPKEDRVKAQAAVQSSFGGFRRW